MIAVFSFTLVGSHPVYEINCPVFEPLQGVPIELDQNQSRRSVDHNIYIIYILKKGSGMARRKLAAARSRMLNSIMMIVAAKVLRHGGYVTRMISHFINLDRGHGEILHILQCIKSTI
eukprot:GHVO01034492.1.p2 GENE.GHVO01034492.1~~GHVO01034492.1.p2  ORF type:complete len:118 (+),score=3.36 GHVO01034492.1:390-743(+)